MVPDEDIVWPNQDDLDAVLIRCSLLADPVVPGIVSHDRPLVRMKWTSEGFPGATRYMERQSTNSFSGNACSKAPDESYFELIVEAGPEEKDDWRGISGMPVFVGRKIVGIVRSVPPNFKAGNLGATPTWKLLDDKVFHETIFGERHPPAKKAKDKLIKVLKRSSSVVEALIDQGQINIGNAMIDLDGERRIERFAESLLLPEKDCRAVIDALYQAYHSLREEDDESGAQSTKAVEAFVNAAHLIVPAIYDYGVIRWTRHQQDISLVPLPVHLKTSAEIIMAGVDGREIHLHHRKSEKDYPEGKLSLPQIPECSIDPENAIAREAQQNHLDRKYNPTAKVEVSRHRLDTYLESKYYQPQSGAPKRTPDERIKLTAGALDRIRRLTGQTLYMLFYLPQDVEAQQAIRSLVQDLKKDYPAIMFLGLDPTVEQEERDQDLLYPFCCMLPVKEPETPDVPPTLPTELPETPSSMSTKRFKIALSFPGEYRDFVEQVAARLADQVGRDQVLYDKYYEAEFARPDLDTYLQRLYHDESELIAVFLCADYERKEWCGLEWRAVRDLIKKRQASTVMPLRFDDTAIPGLFSIDGYVWIDSRTPQQIAELILQRMGMRP